MTNVTVVVGAGSIGQAIARRVSAGKHVVLADLRQDASDVAAKTLRDAGFDVSAKTVDVSSRASVHSLVEAATAIGDVSGVVHAAGVSPTQASPATILKVDLYGTALLLEEFGAIITRGGAAVVIASQSGHRLPPLSVEQNERRLLREALIKARGNRTKAAEFMGISRRTLHRKLAQWPELDVTDK